MDLALRVCGLLFAGVAPLVGPVAILTLLNIEREGQAILILATVALASFLGGLYLAASRYGAAALVIGISALATASVGLGTSMALGGRWWILAMMIYFPAFLAIGLFTRVLGSALRRARSESSV